MLYNHKKIDGWCSQNALILINRFSELTFPSMVVMRSIFDFLIIETVCVGQSEIFIKDI